MIAILLEVGLFALLLFIDLFSKGMIIPFLEQVSGGFYPLIDGVLSLEQVPLNDGASFGFLSGQQGLLIAISIMRRRTVGACRRFSQRVWARFQSFRKW